MASESKKSVLFLNTPLYNVDRKLKYVNIGDNYEITYANSESSLKIENFDISLITIASHEFDSGSSHTPSSRLTSRRKQEIRTSLRNGGFVILLVEREDDLFNMLMDSLKI